MDRRTRYTINAIRETFLELLRNNTVERITVEELCRLADINRSTFYRYYSDIYALFDDICDQYFEKLFNSIIYQANIGGDFEGYGKTIITKACEITYQNKEMFYNLVYLQPSSRFKQRLEDSVYNLYRNAHNLVFPSIAEQQKDMYYHFLVSGVLGIWLKWIKDGCDKSIETIADTVQELIAWHLYFLHVKCFAKDSFPLPPQDIQNIILGNQ